MTLKLLLIGDAGTGKTYYLLKKTSELFKDSIFVSHTNAAVNELKKRDKFSNVRARTLHSICFSLIRRRYDGYRVVSEAARQEFCRRAGLEYNPDPYASSPAKQFFSIKSLYVNLKRPNLDKFCEQYAIDPDPFTQLLEEYEEFKRSRRLIDFEDMLEIALDVDEKLSAGTVIIDEAQDLSPLQWKVAETIFDADVIMAAGDDMQSIFSFQGARPELFLSFSSHVKVLERNYRIPGNLWDFAGEIIKEQLRRPRSIPVDKSKRGEIKIAKPMSFEEAARYIAGYQKGLVIVRHNKFCLTMDSYLRRWGVRPRLVKRDRFNWNAINVDTVHAVKGMEHDRVFVIDAVKKPSFPEEEDRIWYTALTRAKKELHIIPIAGEMNWIMMKLAKKREARSKVKIAITADGSTHNSSPKPAKVGAKRRTPAKQVRKPALPHIVPHTPRSNEDHLNHSSYAAATVPDLKPVTSAPVKPHPRVEKKKGILGRIVSFFKRLF